MGDTLRLLGVFVLSVAFSFALSFFLVKAMPGDFAQDESQLAPVFSESYQLDFSSVAVSYLKGNWGNSWSVSDQSVITLIADSLSSTLYLQILSFIIIVVLSFLLSYLSLQSSSFASGVESFTRLGVAFPTLFLAPVLIYLLSIQLGWAPLRFEGTWASYCLPVICLSLRPLSFSTQILLNTWKNSEFQDYFQVARAKGLSREQAFLRHGLKNSAIGYLTQLGQILGQLLTGSVLVETLFSFPGLGTLFVESLQHRDLPLLLGVVFVFCLIYILIQIGVERLQFWLEPRAGRSLL